MLGGTCEFDNMCRHVSADELGVLPCELRGRPPCPAGSCQVRTSTEHCQPLHLLSVQGFNRALCRYTSDYQQFAPDWDAVTSLAELCLNVSSLLEPRLKAEEEEEEAKRAAKAAADAAGDALLDDEAAEVEQGAAEELLRGGAAGVATPASTGGDVGSSGSSSSSSSVDGGSGRQSVGRESRRR